MKHLFFILLVTNVSVLGQTKKVVYFLGQGLVEYQRPFPTGNGEYKAYYMNMGETLEQGRIVVDSLNKSITIKWLDGDDWIAKYTKKTIKRDVNPNLQSEDEITYTGKWIDNNNPFALIINKGSRGCSFQLKSGKVIDEVYKIDAWKKIFTLFTEGMCLQKE